VPKPVILEDAKPIEPAHPTQEELVKSEKDRINKEIESLKPFVGKPGYNVFTYVKDVVNPVLNSNNLETLQGFHATEEGAKVS
jgi:hypothetical protein